MTAEFELVGTRVALGPVREELYPLFVRWINDPEVGWNVFGEFEDRPLEAVRGWLEGFRTDPATRVWLISRVDEARPIGLAALSEIDHATRSAEFRTLIGEARDRGQGFGRESSELVLRRGFEDLGLHEIHLVVYGYNAAGIRLYERLGFREVAREPMEIERDGRRWDEIRMTLVRPRSRPRASG
jgi:RimJ/RimL family protein N-acetyltransferase